MACTDNIKAMFVLRGKMALYSHELSERRRCELVTEAEIEDEQFLFNVFDFLSMRMCKSDGQPRLVLTFDSSYLASDPGGSVSVSIHNGKGEQTAPFQLSSTNTDTEIASAVISSLDFQQLSGTVSPISGLLTYYKSAENQVTIIFKRGYTGFYTANFTIPNSPSSFVTISGGPTAEIPYEMGCMKSAAGDGDSIKRIAQWFSYRITSACSDPVYVTNRGKCPPDEYISCDLLSSSLFSFLYYDDLVAGGLTSVSPLPATTPPVNIQVATSSFVSPIMEIDISSNPQITLTESTSGDVYYFEPRTSGIGTWAGGATFYWQVVSVIPFGDTVSVNADEIQVEPDATYTWGGSIPIKTIKGNTCEVPLKNKITGSDFYTILPAPMVLQPIPGLGILISFNEERITGRYSQEIVPKSPSIVSLYKDGAVIYEWEIGSNPYVSFVGDTFTLEIPPEVGPLEDPGTYTFSWPLGWVCGKDSLALAAAVNVDDYTYVVAESAVGFDYEFDLELS